MQRSGRPKLGGVAFSRLNFSCAVTSCAYSARSDALKRHYLTNVKFDETGRPLLASSEGYSGWTRKQKQHTKYFVEHNFNQTSLPPMKKPVSAAAVHQFFTPPPAAPRSADEPASGEKGSEGDVDENDLVFISEAESDPDVVATSERDHQENEIVVGDIDEVEEDADLNNNPSQGEEGTSLAQEISDNILARLGVNEGMTLKEAIAEAVASRLSDKKSDEGRVKGDWIEGGNNLTCATCLHLDTVQIPQALKSFRKGNFGVITNKSSYEAERNKNIHEKYPLHKWCYQKINEKRDESKNARDKNKAAAELLATNAAFCLLTGGSAKDFVRLNSKDCLVPGLTTATKNDGEQEFFSYRDIFFLKLSEGVKVWFKDHIKSFSCTLDKITVQRIPYFAVLTYFFWEGRISILLNSVHRIKSDQADSNETAQMVITILTETLGLSLSALKSKIHHFSYDGVYCTREERTTNNGLALTDFFAELLGLEKGDITGNHDMSHNLQLVFSDVFKHDRTGDKKVKKLTQEIFEIMADYNSGEGGTVFHETAMRMNRTVLTNKTRQETRFVRSDLRGIQSYMVNLPTLFNIQGEIMEQCNMICDNTGAKQAKALMDKMSDGKRLATLTGLAYLENQYAICSVQSQHARTFPITIMAEILKLDDELEELSKCWVWSKEDMKLAGFGRPNDIIQDLLSGIYKPRVKPGCTKRSNTIHSIYRKEHRRQQDNLLSSGISEEEMEDILNWAPILAENDEFDGSGSFAVAEFGVSCKKQVETHLQGLAQHLHERLGARLKILPLTLSSLEAFGGNLEWVNPDRASTSWHGEAKTRLKAVFEDLVGLAKDDFEYDSCWPIYVVFLSFARGKIIAAGGKLDLEKIWIMFWEIGSENEEFLNFIELFDDIMIKSYSEAIAECVGSLMNLQIGSGRNLHPVNLNKELFLRFNLGPLHVIKVNLIPQVVKVY